MTWTREKTVLSARRKIVETNFREKLFPVDRFVHSWNSFSFVCVDRLDRRFAHRHWNSILNADKINRIECARFGTTRVRLPCCREVCFEPSNDWMKKGEKKWFLSRLEYKSEFLFNGLIDIFNYLTLNHYRRWDSVEKKKTTTTTYSIGSILWLDSVTSCDEKREKERERRRENIRPSIWSITD